MIHTELLTFLLSFKNTDDKIIFNVSKYSIERLIEAIKCRELKFDSVKQLDNNDYKFKRIPKQKLLSIIDQHTELYILLTK